MVYLINCIVMRKFDYILPAPAIGDQFGPIDDVEGHPAYQPSVFDAVQVDELEDGSLIFSDMTAILLNQEKSRRLLGDMNVNNILAQMHPTQSTAMDGMTDEQRFGCVISRHCQTMSERQAVLRQLASEKSELMAYAEAMLAEQTVEPAPEASAPAGSAQ